MITLIAGENTFENDRAVRWIVAAFDGAVERADGETLEIKQLPDLLMGATLFADKRLVVVKNLSENRAVWTALPEWLGRVSDDIHLVLVEAKPDKRTKTYKELQKSATLHESKLWTERDAGRAEQWAVDEAKNLGFALDKKSAHTLVVRVGVDQWLLWQALQKLVVLDVVTPEVIEEIIEANPAENVFNLFEAALRGNTAKVRQMVQTLELTEDPFRLFGLLSGQAFQLAALAVADVPSSVVAGDMGAHPFALSKLAPFAKTLSKTGAKQVIAAFAEADAGMKTSVAEPWLLVERALLKTAHTTT